MSRHVTPEPGIAPSAVVWNVVVPALAVALLLGAALLPTLAIAAAAAIAIYVVLARATSRDRRRRRMTARLVG